MDKKIVSISSKRQITIPQRYFDMLGFADSAECFIRDNELVLRPLNRNYDGEVASQILEQLISSGLSGKELLKQFKIEQAKAQSNVEKIISVLEKRVSEDDGYESAAEELGIKKKDYFSSCK